MDNQIEYEALKSHCIDSGISNRKQYRTLFDQKKLPKGSPEYPENSYADWQGWNLFLGKLLHKPEYESYSWARSYIRKNFPDIQTVAQYRKAYSDGKLDPKMPKYPTSAYKKEWTSWSDFLLKGAKRNSYLPIEEAAKKMRKLNLKTSTEFLEWIKTNTPPEGCPKAPWVVYKDVFKSFGGWKAYLGNQYMSYEEARDYIRAVKPRITGFVKYREWVDAGHRPENFPSQPHTFSGYREQWINYPEFLGTKKAAKTTTKADKEKGLKQIKKILTTHPDLIDDVLAIYS